ncbi:MAG: apolipoprotein N-acyltransferase [Candidatus Eremiobacteraeota bacterium]|nr:apolipoprotein N-acyltransferase [Candidatus Eremiobacteraeota bacterium]
MLSSSRLRDLGVVACAAIALAAAFPKLGAAWLVPFAAAAQFWVWQTASWRWAALLGWFAGMIFFAIGFEWIGHTVGAYIGIFGPFLMFGPALIEAPFFALAAVLAAVAYRYVRPGYAPLAAAAAFSVAEWLRSIGPIGAPFDQLGYTQAESPLRALAAYAGSYGITFVLCILGAYIADALHRRTWRTLAGVVAAVAICTSAAWLAWPARRLPAPTIEVAAIQGNIAQSLKWNAPLDLSVTRYSMMTRIAAARKPKLIVWPETVITTTLDLDPSLMQRFENLAMTSRATIVAGSLSLQRRHVYNALYIFAPNGGFAIYGKRQLVPFAESFPGRPFLSWLPYVGELSGRFSTGKFDGVYSTQALPIAPLICWESAFADLAFAQVRRGAQLLVVSTDDAWFGTTSGPYMHAQIAQIRAIEVGAYVVRAAATGISGVIAPDGSWQKRSRMEDEAIVAGKVGPRVPTVFARVGPTEVALALLCLYGALFLVPRRRDRRA